MYQIAGRTVVAGVVAVLTGVISAGHVHAGRSEPVGILVEDGSEIVCDPIRGGREFLYTMGLRALTSGHQANAGMWIRTDDHPPGGSFYTGGSNGIVEWVEAGIIGWCDPLKNQDVDCTEEGTTVTYDTYVAGRGVNPRSGSVEYWSDQSPFFPHPSPSNPIGFFLLLVEDTEGVWYGGVAQYGPTAASWNQWVRHPLIHQERGHFIQTGPETTYPTDIHTVIHRTWFMGPEYTHDESFGSPGPNWSNWPDYAQIEQNSPPPAFRGINAPLFFCAHMNTFYMCWPGTGPKTRPPVPPPCPATPTPTATSTPTPVPTSTPTPSSCPFSPEVCQICATKGQCSLCCQYCIWFPGSEYCEAYEYYCSGRPCP